MFEIITAVCFVFALQISRQKMIEGKAFWKMLKDKSLSDYIRQKYFVDYSETMQ